MGFFSLNKNKTWWQLLFISPASWTQICCICQHKSVTGDVLSWYFTQLNIPAWEIPKTSHWKYSITLHQANPRLQSKRLNCNYNYSWFLSQLEKSWKIRSVLSLCSVWRVAHCDPNLKLLKLSHLPVALSWSWLVRAQLKTGMCFELCSLLPALGHLWAMGEASALLEEQGGKNRL